jgi:hypothetical protein
VPDEPAPVVPATESAAAKPEPTRAGGFLLNERPNQPLDGEQLFRQAIAPPPSATPASDSTGQPLGADVTSGGMDNVTLCRLAGIALVVFGLLALNSTREIPLPAALIVGGLVLAVYIGSPARLKREQIVDRWDMLMDGATGRRSEVMQGTVTRIDSQQLPQIHHETRDLAASLLRASTRPFLVVTHSGNRRLAPYRMHVSVRDYGTALQASWYLSYHRSFFEKLIPDPLVKLDLFDEQDLRAYATTVHHAFLDAVVDLMVALGKDASTLKRDSRGFLGIS